MAKYKGVSFNISQFLRYLNKNKPLFMTKGKLSALSGPDLYNYFFKYKLKNIQ